MEERLSRRLALKKITPGVVLSLLHVDIIALWTVIGAELTVLLYPGY